MDGKLPAQPANKPGLRRQGRYQRRSAKDFFCNLSHARRLVRRNSMNSDFYIENEKMRGSGLFTTSVPYSSTPDKSNDFLTLLEKMQSQRLDEQRCEMPDLHVQFGSPLLLRPRIAQPITVRADQSEILL
ncbi:unnamed protein product [Cylicocyclus nassatus]|uniref:Uncharacterized protein n=1 Tax=Cylicocyclus nassatus TaxID=53992 RepID=A0AA36MCF7_CYLNA|nr:unnamed protein product [Cylicocyclus nassatus]